MRHLAPFLPLVLPLLTACDGTGRYLAEQKQLRVVQAYGQSVLNAYAAQPAPQPVTPQPVTAQPVTAQPVTQQPCEKILKKSLPRGVSECVLYTWNGQAVAEITHWHSTQPSTSHESDMVTRVGKMHGLASDAELTRFGKKVAQEYKNWVGSPAYTAWEKAQPTSTTPRFGFSQDCREFSSLALPAGVQTCIQGPGLADGPTITLRLADGRFLMFDAY